MESLQPRHQRIVYLLTYSRADFSKIASRERFADAVVKAWEKNGMKVAQWVVSVEQHMQPCVSESSSNAYHFHMALKLQKRGRWLQVRNYLDEKFGIQVHFSGNHNTYYRVYQKKCPKWKIASTSDIPQNLGYFLPARISRSLLVYLGQKIIFPSTFMLPGGVSCRLILT